MEKRLYHILTPLPPEELRNVNCLLVGAISIPQCVLKSQVGVAPRGQPWRKLAVGVIEGGGLKLGQGSGNRPLLGTCLFRRETPHLPTRAA